MAAAYSRPLTTAGTLPGSEAASGSGAMAAFPVARGGGGGWCSGEDRAQYALRVGEHCVHRGSGLFPGRPSVLSLIHI